MKKSLFNKTRKGIALGLAIGTTMISTIVPVLANEVPQPQISTWSIGTLNEGEKYGIYPMAWYYDGFQESISQDKLNILVGNVDEKLSGLELEKDETFKPKAYEEDGTRGAVLTALYNSLASYKLPDVLGDIDDPIDYMQQRGIVKGTNKGLVLEEACTVEQATVFVTKLIEDTYSTLGAGSKGLMWKVTKGENTLYLLGSIHIGDTNLYPLQQTVKDAFKESDVLVVEANVLGNQEGLDDFIKAAMYADGTKLQDNVSEETYKKCMKVLEQYGFPADTYDQFKPWVIANELSVVAASNANSLEEGAQAGALGIDMYFLTTGMLIDKPVVELEGMMYQAGLFNGLSSEMQEEQLNAALDSILNPDSEEASQTVEALNLWLEQWYKGDIAGFASSFATDVEASQGEFEAMLFGKRDKDMADKLAGFLEKDGKTTYFVVVGAGHLVVKDTVIDQLKNKGYVVETFGQ